MYRRELLFLLLFAAPVCAEKHKKLGKKKCAAIDRRIKRMESKMRQGHSAKQGRTMKRQVRELQLKRFRHCR